MKPRRTMTVGVDVQDILGEISEGQSSSSAYLGDLVRDAERDWRTALRGLRSAGWVDAEIRAACDVLNGYHLAWDLGHPATMAALELYDGQRLNDVCSKHEVDPAAWDARIQAIRENEPLARCLLAFVREFWRFNPRLDRAIGLGGES